MPYLIETFDKPASRTIREDQLGSHLDFLDSRTHLLLACGAKLDEQGQATGGIYILDVNHREEAEEFIGSDPFTRAGLFHEVLITRWRKSYFNRTRCSPPKAGRLDGSGDGAPAEETR